MARRFHWRFWRPLFCVGGSVRFGFYYVSAGTEVVPPHTARCFRFKEKLGMFCHVRHQHGA